MMVVTNAALRAFNFQLDAHQKVLANAEINEESGDSTDEEKCL